MKPIDGDELRRHLEKESEACMNREEFKTGIALNMVVNYIYTMPTLEKYDCSKCREEKLRQYEEMMNGIWEEY